MSENHHTRVATIIFVTDTKESNTCQKPAGGAPDSLGLGKQYSRLLVTQYTSAREVSEFRNIGGAILVHAGASTRMHPCRRISHVGKINEA
jgi:hypothetical protein